MKYSEFETIAKENGWNIKGESSGWIRVNKNGFEMVISKSVRNYLDLYTKKISAIKLYKEKSFIKACYELAETPIEDR